MNPKKSALLVAILLLLGISVAYLLQLPGIVHPLLTNTLFLLPPTLAVLSGLYTTRIYHSSNPHGRVMAYLTAGLSCWLIGEVIFYIFQFVTHTNPFPSIADVFYLAAYPLLMIGLIKEAIAHHANWRHIRADSKLILTLSSFLVLALAFIVIYFGVYVAYQSDAPLLNNFIAISYGIGDLLLLIPVLFILKMVLDFRGGKLFYSWTLLLLALLCIMTGDILFAIYPDQYEALVAKYTLIDLAWVAGYLLFAYSFFYTGRTIKEIHSSLLKKAKSKTTA